MKRPACLRSSCLVRRRRAGAIGAGALGLSAFLAVGLAGPRAAATAGAAAPLEPWIANHPLRQIKSETLSYLVTARKIIRFPVGVVTFKLSREAAPGGRQLVLRAIAKGGVPGYPVLSTITSRLRCSDYGQIVADYHRVKPSYRRKVTLWRKYSIDYLKHKHCEAPTLCHDPRHWVPRPDGTRAHCSAEDCQNLDHHVWAVRERHGAHLGRVHDVIAAVYVARGLDLRPGGPARAVRVVSHRDMWDITFKVRGQETVEVPAGKIPCYRLSLKFRPIASRSKRHAREFEGPFGLKGRIRVYVARDTRHLVLVQGEVELGLTYDVEVKLADRKVERE